MYRLVVSLLLAFSLQTVTASAVPLKICIDNNNWLPFIYIEDSQAKGIHIEIISSTLTSLNYQFEFHPVPWKRCLKGLEQGFYDAVATASYNDERNQYLFYPQDAGKVTHSDWRVSQVEYIIATNADNPFTFEHDLSKIPQPIRVPRGYSIAQDLKNKDIPVDDSSINDMQNIKRLLREQNGSVITLPTVIDWYNSNYQSDLVYKEVPLTSKSYFFAISRRGQLNQETANRIWQRISESRSKVLDVLSKQMMDEEQR